MTPLGRFVLVAIVALLVVQTHETTSYRTSRNWITSQYWTVARTTPSAYTQCGGTFTSADGVITSPNYPGEYPPNADCTYTIHPMGKTELILEALDIEKSYDHIQILHESGYNETLLDFANSKQSWNGSSFQIHFTSDGNIQRSGFRFVFRPVAGNKQYSTLNKSPYWYRTTTPSYWHRTDRQTTSDWRYMTTPPYWHRTSRQATSDWRYTDRQTTSDWRYRTTPPYWYPTGRQTTSDWRYSTTPPYWYQTTSTSAYTQCGGKFTSANGVITSPNYPGEYPPNSNCTYTILPMGETELILEALDIEKGYDHIAIYISKNTGQGYTPMERISISGNDTNTTKSWHGLSFHIHFTSDYSVQKSGFRFVFHPVGGYQKRISVSCDGMDFKVSVPRDLLRQILPGVSVYDLTLNDPSCKGQVFYDTVMFRSSVLGCGMTREETSLQIVYKNQIGVPRNQSNSIISRLDNWGINVQCFMDRDVSAVGFYKPTSEHMWSAVGNGNFTVSMDFYRDYSMNVKISAYPASVKLNEDLFVDIGLDTPDVELKIAIQTCYATPYLDPYNYHDRYDLIKYGCPSDNTVSFQHSNRRHVNFRFRTFKLLHHQNGVYIHCHVNVCNANETTGRCRRDCNHRRRRDVENNGQHDLQIFQGPLRVNGDPGGGSEEERQTKAMAGGPPAVAMVVGALSVVTLMTVVGILLVRYRRRLQTPTAKLSAEAVI